MTTRTTMPADELESDQAVSIDDERSRTHALFMPVIVIAVLNSVMTGSMVNVLLPDMKDAFNVSPAAISWVITAYSLMYAVGIPLIGRMSDLISARTLFVAGLGGFALGSAISAVAPSLPLLVVGRLVQGAGGAAIPALAMVMIARTLAEDRRGSAMGLIGSAAGTGAAIGPFVGAFVGDTIGWRGLFLLPMLVSVAIIPLVRKAMPKAKGSGGASFDIIGGALLGSAIGLFLFGITQGEASGFGSFGSLASFLVAMVAGAGFALRISRVPDPFVPPALFKNGAYMRMMGTGAFAIMTYMSSLVLVPLMLVDYNDISVTRAGLALTPGAIAVAVGSRYSGRLADRIGARTPIITGVTILLLAVAAISTVGAGASAWVVAGGMLAVGAGNSLITAPLNSSASRTLTPETTGIGMGLLSGISFLGGGIGAAISGAWLSARLRADGEALNPFYTGEAGAWSDAFAGVTLMAAIALLMAVKIRPNRPFS